MLSDLYEVISQISRDDVWLGMQILACVFVAGALLRFIYCAIGQTFGFYDPAHDAAFPRLPWRPLWRAWIRFKEWKEQFFDIGKGSSAKWTSVFSALALQYREGDVLLGRVWTPFGGWVQPMGLSAVQRHLMMIAGAGSGKTVFMITMISKLKANASAFIVDPKGQIAKVLVPALRRRGRKIHVLDPMGITPFKTASWNALDEIPRINERLGEEMTTLYLEKIAAADIPKSAKENPFFPDSARIIWAALLAYVYVTYPPAERNAITARRLLMQGLAEYAEPGEDPLLLLWLAMKNAPHYDGFISKAGSMFATMDDRTRSSVLATARTGTKYLDHAQVKRVSQSSSFDLTDLKGGKDFVMLCAPTTEIRGTLSPWFRVLTMSSLWIFEQIPGGLKDPSLFAIDELPALGHIEDLQMAAPVMRGYGVRLLGIAQDLEALKRAYPEGWGGLLGNSECTFFMGVGHKATAEYISAELGKSKRVEKTGRGERATRQTYERELATPDQVQRILAPRKNNMIILRFGERPLRAKQMPYFRWLPVWLYDPDPEHEEPEFRAQFREWLSTSETQRTTERRSSLSEADARAIFGLSGRFSSTDLRARAQMLEGRFPDQTLRQARATLEALL